MNAPATLPLLDIAVLAPDASILRDADRVWVAWGLPDCDAGRLRRERDDDGRLEEELCIRQGDASILRLRLDGGVPIELAAWKGLTSCHEIFFAVRPEGPVLIADHFRNVLAALPVAQRAPSTTALVDHFVFRTIPAPLTLCAAVKRLGRGERMELCMRRRTVRTSTFDRATGKAAPGSVEGHVDAIEQALGDALDPLRGDKAAATLFSGGVDSTLIHSYLAPHVAAVHYVLPDYDRAFERHYADRAARHLGVELRKVEVSNEGYLDRVVRAIVLTGMPSPHLQFGFYESMFALDHQRFVLGEQGDALFGIGVLKARAAARIATPFRVRMLELAAPFVPASRRRRWMLLPSTARRLMADPRAQHGYANRIGVYTDDALTDAIFGDGAVAERIAARRRELDRIADVTAAEHDRFLCHVETAQLLDYLTEDMVMCYRHLAHGHGKSLVAPFIDKRVFDAALAVPAAERYVRGLQGKFLLKSALAKRVPAYPVGQRKGYTGLSFERYFRYGPLARAWESYSLPDVVPPELRDTLREDASIMAWNALTLAIWEREVMSNPQLRPLPATRHLAWSEEDHLVPIGSAETRNHPGELLGLTPSI